MKILMIGLHSGWMGLHLSHFRFALQQRNVEVICADYHRMGYLFGLLKVPGEAERRDRALEQMIQSHKPDIVLFVSGWKFDLARLRSYFKGNVAVYDYDGPRRKSLEDYEVLFDQKIDRFFTVSRWLQRKLREKEKTAVYLPHGVNMATKKEASEKIIANFEKIPGGFAYTITIGQRYLEPLVLKEGFVSGFGLFVHDRDRKPDGKIKYGGISNSVTPGQHCDHLPKNWPIMIFVK